MCYEWFLVQGLHQRMKQSKTPLGAYTGVELTLLLSFHAHICAPISQTWIGPGMVGVDTASPALRPASKDPVVQSERQIS